MLQSLKDLVSSIQNSLDSPPKTIGFSKIIPKNFFLDNSLTTDKDYTPMELREREILAKVISLVLGLGVSFSITYFGVKYLTKALDPTRKDKEKSETKVSFN